MAQGLPFSTYGENLILAAQSALLILLIWGYGKTTSREKVLAALGLGAWAYAALMPGVLSSGAMWYFSMFSVLLGLFCKVP